MKGKLTTSKKEGSNAKNAEKAANERKVIRTEGDQSNKTKQKREGGEGD